MVGRVVEVLTKGTKLKVSRGHLVVSMNEIETKIPIDDISVLILGNTGVTLSTNLMTKLVDNGSCIMLLSSSYEPLSIIGSATFHSKHHERVSMQLSMSEPLKKNLWKEIVKCKIKHQSEVLKLYEKHKVDKLKVILNTVKSGDSGNAEAYAARLYWDDLFGESFVRNINGDGINSMLNYGYSILRSSVARAVVARGLNSTLGVFHRNKQNPFCLVDDLMEPFRPLVDMVVYDLSLDGVIDLSPEVKKKLAGILMSEVKMPETISPVSSSILQLVDSYVGSLESKKVSLETPLSIIPRGKL